MEMDHNKKEISVSQLLLNADFKDTLCSPQLDRGVPDKAPSGRPRLCPHRRSSPPPRPEKCALCSGT